MKKYTKIALVSVLAGTVSACSSSGSDDPTPVTDLSGTTAGPADDPTGNTTTTGVPVPPSSDTTAGTSTTGASTGSATTTTAGITTAGATTNGATTDGSATAGTSTDGATTTGTSTDGTTTTGTSTDGATTTGASTDGSATAGTSTAGVATDGTTTDGTTTPENPTGGDSVTPSGTSPLGNPPTLADPFAEPTPSPDSADPFGALLEVDAEVATVGGPPTTPKFLRVDLVSNDWAEINWAPSNDDVGVVEYRIYRSDKTDGPTYTVREDTVSTSSGTQDEIDKFWLTTSFIDCNYTRFDDLIHACTVNGPSPGDRFSYQVTAVDADGQESPRSNTITVLYHAETNAPVPKYRDFYKAEEDTFAQDHDLSDTSYFLGQILVSV